ncbi:MAG TPA: response regulator transcription factor [Acidimicrobiia bacterium]|nr:response regulator transcription factor [Acidimicrobiia bacterium]
MSAPIRVLIVDDHPVVRDGLAGMLAGAEDLEVVGQGSNGREALALVEELNPDVVLMDLKMPHLDGIAATKALVLHHPDLKVLVLTTYDTTADVRSAIAAGASGYLLKDAPRSELFAAIRTVAQGQTVMAPGVANALANTSEDPVTPLTEREVAVLELIAEGSSNREVGQALYVSEATVKTHLIHIYDKLGVDSRTAAVTAALRAGLIRLD